MPAPPEATREQPLPLFARFPALQDVLPRVDLITPTPVQQLASLAHSVGADSLWIKRDDLTAPACGGNKARKLEFILPEIRAAGKTRVVTIGGTGSTHCRATAIHAAQQGISSTLILFDQAETEEVRQNLSCCEDHADRIIRTRSVMAAAAHFHVHQRLTLPEAYFLPAGGTLPASTWGYVNTAFELKRQIDSGELPVPGSIFVTLGTGGTLAGLELGLRLAGLETKLFGVRVVPCGVYARDRFDGERTVSRLVRACLGHLQEHEPQTRSFQWSPGFKILHEYVGQGYGVPTAEGQRAANLMRQTTGIALDPTYTAKTFAAVLDHIRDHPHPEKPVLYWHTFSPAPASRPEVT